MKPFILIFSIFVFSKVADTACGVRLVNPEPFTVITSKIYRLKAELDCSIDELDSLVFYANYAELGHKRETKGLRRPIKTLIAPPLEYIWDCSNIPDQDFWCAGVQARAFLKDGRTLIDRSTVAFDRNLKIKDEKLVSWYNRKSMNIDGKFDEWIKKDSIEFTFSDNIVTAFSNWNKAGLYFAILVKDEHIVNTYTRDELEKLYRHDGLHFRFDPFLKRKHFYGKTHRILQIAPNSLFQFSSGHIDTTEHRILVDSLSGSLEFRFNLHGTLNDDSDQDSGYLLEIFFPWKDLGIKDIPRAMGFILSGSDTDNKDKESTLFSWTNLYGINMSNPSEWATLELSGGGLSDYLKKMAVVFILLFGAFIFYAGIKKKKSRPSGQEVKPEFSSPFQNTVNSFLERNYKDQNLGLDNFAEALSLQKDYFRQKFKKEFNINFPDYLNQFRINKAKNLLVESDLSVMDIAIMVGFKSLENFARTFKKQTGQSPTEWRNAQKSAKKQ
jgi:AraC-like DNA-binding protein